MDELLQILSHYGVEYLEEHPAAVNRLVYVHPNGSVGFGGKLGEVLSARQCSFCDRRIEVGEDDVPLCKRCIGTFKGHAKADREAEDEIGREGMEARARDR